MNLKKILLIIMLTMVFSLAIGPVVAKTENVKPSLKNSKFHDNSTIATVKTTSKNFVVTHTMKAITKFKNPDSQWTGYVTVKSKNSKIKIKSIKINQGNGFKGFTWKTYKINSNKKTIKLGKNILAKYYVEGKGYQLAYIINY